MKQAIASGQLLRLGAPALVWFGLLLGVSFLATPVKFLAPSLSLPVALDVGRQTFLWFNRLELLLGISLLIVALLARRPVLTGLVGGLLALVALQSLWLLPVLDARVEVILQGGSPPSSHLHEIYIAVDGFKLALLGLLAYGGLTRR